MFGLRGAVTVQRRVVGLTFNDVGSGDFRQSATRYDMMVDCSAEWDAMSLKVPIAAILEYELNARLAGTGVDELEEEAAATHALGAGIYYTGHPNLQVGVFEAAVGNLRPIAGFSVSGAQGASGTPRARYGELVLRYIW
jgi:hypothetical protein